MVCHQSSRAACITGIPGGYSATVPLLLASLWQLETILSREIQEHTYSAVASGKQRCSTRSTID